MDGPVLGAQAGEAKIDEVVKAGVLSNLEELPRHNSTLFTEARP